MMPQMWYVPLKYKKEAYTMKGKLCAFLLVLCMVATLFTGFATAEGTDTGKKYPVIRMCYQYYFENSAKDEALVEDALNKIMREKAGAEVDLVGIPFANWATQLNLMLTGGEDSLDLVSSFWYTSASNLAANGQIIPLDDLLNQYGQEIKAQFTDPAFLNCGAVNGKLYGIPSITAWCSENGYYVKTDKVEGAGVDMSKIHDLQTMTDAMIQMKKAYPDSYFIPGSTEPYWIPKDIDYLGDTKFLGVLTDPANSTTVENYYESNYFLNFLKYVQIWKDNGLFSPDPLSNSDATLMNLQAGVVEGTPGYNYDTYLGELNIEGFSGVDLKSAAISKCLATTGDVTTYMWHISSFCKNPDAAMKVLNVLYSDPDAAQLVANGIEGKHYVLDANGQMQYLEGQNSMSTTWGVGSMAIWPNSTLCKTWYYQPKDIYDQIKAKVNSAIKSKALGFQFDSSAVTNETTACSNVIAQYYNPLMYAEVDISQTLPEFQQALRDAGIDTIIAEKQKQLDAWLAAKQ